MCVRMATSTHWHMLDITTVPFGNNTSFSHFCLECHFPSFASCYWMSVNELWVSFLYICLSLFSIPFSLPPLPEMCKVYLVENIQNIVLLQTIINIYLAWLISEMWFLFLSGRDRDGGSGLVTHRYTLLSDLLSFPACSQRNVLQQTKKKRSNESQFIHRRRGKASWGLLFQRDTCVSPYL